MNTDTAQNVAQVAALPERLAYNFREACAMLNVSASTLARLEKRKLIRSVPYLRTKLFPRKELERFLANLDLA